MRRLRLKWLVLLGGFSCGAPSPNAKCGDGNVDPGELCDLAIASGVGACPSACDDKDPCTQDALEGSACQARCTHSPITVHKTGDQCCPAGANLSTDGDCSAACGNGVLENGELCDTALPVGAGGCPTEASCDDGNACTHDVLKGTNCALSCEHSQITVFIGGDQCCPSGANATTDPDCKPVCGNGVLEKNEVCDPQITSGPGKCPTTVDCDDQIACTQDVVELIAGNACSATCKNNPITQAKPGDACCPPGATPGTDPDCAGCGDGVVQANETCDIAVTSGPHVCPTQSTCNDNNACTVDQLVGAGTCTAACSHAPNLSLANGDGCCADPENTTPTQDSDCPKLLLGRICDSNTDCASNQCEAFGVSGGQKICTSGCHPAVPTPQSDCPQAPNVYALCLSRAQNNGVSNVCLYTLDEAPAAALIANAGGYNHGFSAADQYFFWMLPTYNDGVQRRWRLTLSPSPSLDIKGLLLAPSLSASSYSCNSAGPGGTERCEFTLTASESYERFWFQTSPASGTGTYSIELEEIP